MLCEMNMKTMIPFGIKVIEYLKVGFKMLETVFNVFQRNSNYSFEQFDLDILKKFVQRILSPTLFVFYFHMLS